MTTQTRKLFGTDGVRGEAGTFLTAELATALGRAVTASLDAGRPQVLIVRDTRESGPMLEAALAAGVAAAGGDALLGGVLPTPAAAILVKRLGLDLAAVVSASHNPYRDNGIKFFSGQGTKLGDELEARIESLVDERGFALALQARLAEPGLLRFRDRAEFVAAALVGFAEGRAERCWWLAEFDGLHALSRSTALRTLVINESDAGIAALARLTDGALASVLGTVGDGDGMRLLAWFGLRGGATLAPLAALWPAALALPPAGATTAWLRALVAAERVLPGSAGTPTLRCLRSLVALYALARDGALAPSMLGADPRAALHHALAAHRFAAEWLEAAADSDVAALAADLAQRAPATGDHDRAAPAAWLDSPHGGLFILLGRAQRLGWIGRWHALLRAAWPPVVGPALADEPDDPTHGADALCRALVLRVATLALAGPDAARVRADAAVRSVCGPDGSDELVEQHSGLAVAALRAVLRVRPASALAPRESPSHALKRLLAEAAARLLDDCARALPGLLGSSSVFLRAQALTLPVRLQYGMDGTDSLACLGRAPLDVLLVLAGAKRIRIELPGVPAIRCVGDIGA